MKLLDKKEFTTVTVVDTYSLPNGFTLTVTTVNGQCRGQELKKDKSIIPKDHNPHYYYFNNVNVFKELLRKTTFMGEDRGNEIWFNKFIDNDMLGTVTKHGFNPENIIVVDGYCHTFRDVQERFLPQCIILDYIGGFKEKDPYKAYAWEPLKAYLKTHPQVIAVEEFRIPSYNADFGGQRGLSVKMTFLPEWRLDGDLAYNEETAIFSDKDPLGIKKFKINS